ncbi:hypothetical protein AB0K60_04755 [Thermopolyspora sp. NPDC052614]|uniref:hypothetical protein n=1 Tax=Thermopolyspora sp. NPDC052614 TaxID=3155682 RepID=UPI003423FCE4
MIVLLCLAICGMAAPAAADPDEGDVQAVYCLATDRRARLAEAAFDLNLAKRVPGSADGLLVDGRTYTIEEWRAKSPADFRRACRALMATVPQLAPAEEQNWLISLLNTLASLAAGAALTLLAQRVESNRSRRVAEAEALRQALNGFLQQAQDYVDQWAANPRVAHASVAAKRSELTAELRRFLDFRRYRKRIERLLADLPLGEDLNTEYPGDPDFQQRSGHGVEQRRLLAETAVSVEALIRDHRFGVLGWPRRGRKPSREAIGRSAPEVLA